MELNNDHAIWAYTAPSSLTGEDEAMAIDVRVRGPNALRWEYERHEVRASGNVWVSNPLDDTGAERIRSVFGPGFSEKLPGVVAVDARPLNDDVGDADLIRKYPVQ